MKSAKKTTARKRGRPAKYAAKRVTISVRLQQSVYQQVAAAAEAHGRSISEEFEQRINRSFEDETAFPDPELRQLAIRLITRFSDAGRLVDINRSGTARPVREWINDPDSYEGAMLAVIEHLAIANPAMSNMEIYDFINLMRSNSNHVTPQRLREIFIKQRNEPTTNTSTKDKELK
jgi:hypothetical protein